MEGCSGYSWRPVRGRHRPGLLPVSRRAQRPSSRPPLSCPRLRAPSPRWVLALTTAATHSTTSLLVQNGAGRGRAEAAGARRGRGAAHAGRGGASGDRTRGDSAHKLRAAATAACGYEPSRDARAGGTRVLGVVSRRKEVKDLTSVEHSAVAKAEQRVSLRTGARGGLLLRGQELWSQSSESRPHLVDTGVSRGGFIRRRSNQIFLAQLTLAAAQKGAGTGRIRW